MEETFSSASKCRYATMEDWERMELLMKINCGKLGLDWAKYEMIA